MKQQLGKFILFDVPEFASWLDTSSFSRVIHLLQCHHTYIPSYEHFHQTNHFDLLEAMERAHLERGFSEIAQNLTTFPDGSVAVCRSIDTIPAGIKGANRNGGWAARTETHRNPAARVVFIVRSLARNAGIWHKSC